MLLPAGPARQGELGAQGPDTAAFGRGLGIRRCGLGKGRATGGWQGGGLGAARGSAREGGNEQRRPDDPAAPPAGCDRITAGPCERGRRGSCSRSSPGRIDWPSPESARSHADAASANRCCLKRRSPRCSWTTELVCSLAAACVSGGSAWSRCPCWKYAQPERVEERRILGIDLQRALQQLDRFVEPIATIGEHVAERVERVGVLRVPRRRDRGVFVSAALVSPFPAGRATARAVPRTSSGCAASSFRAVASAAGRSLVGALGLGEEVDHRGSGCRRRQSIRLWRDARLGRLSGVDQRAARRGTERRVLGVERLRRARRLRRLRPRPARSEVSASRSCPRK